MLIVVLNCFVFNNKGRAEGYWFDVLFVGPNSWRFQNASFEEKKFKDYNELACLETLRRLPMPNEEIVHRLVFEAHCRGESLTAAGEVISDVCQLVYKIKMDIENRRFEFDDNNVLRSYADFCDETIVYLEVTGFQSLRAKGYLNSNRISAKVMRTLGSREGARVWSAHLDGQQEPVLIFERLTGDASFDAMERMDRLHRVFYYDIETTSSKLNADSFNPIITSIGGISKDSKKMKLGAEDQYEVIQMTYLDGYESNLGYTTLSPYSVKYRKEPLSKCKIYNPILFPVYVNEKVRFYMKLKKSVTLFLFASGLFRFPGQFKSGLCEVMNRLLTQDNTKVDDASASLACSTSNPSASQWRYRLADYSPLDRIKHSDGAMSSTNSITTMNTIKLNMQEQSC